MKQVIMNGAGGPDVLEIVEADMPEPRAGEIRIKLDYAGVNRPDLMQRAGLYPPPPDASPILGLECSGIVDAVGEGANWQVGDAVCALLPGGGYAEYAICDGRHALPVPKGIGMDMAASLPETYFTVWANVFQRARLQKGENFLVHGGTSGIGVAALSLSKAFGARSFATVGNAEKVKFCESLGATAINYKEQDFEEVLRELGVKMDVVLDMVGGDYVEKNINIAALEGRIVNIAFQKGAKVELNLMKVMMKRLTLTGSTLRARSNDDKAKIAKELHEQVWPLLERGEVSQKIHKVFDFEDVQKAHEALEAGGHIGKILLRVNA